MPHFDHSEDAVGSGADELLLPDLILADVVDVLESWYQVSRDQVAGLARSIVAFDAIRTIDAALLLRSIEVYERHRIDFADAYLVASAETAGVGEIASLDRSLDRVGSITRIEP